MFKKVALILLMLGILINAKHFLSTQQESFSPSPSPTVLISPSPLSSASAIPNDIGARELAQVVRVVDGDTIVVTFNGKEEKLRLIGIDTPETVDPRKPVQCFGKEASNKAKELLSGKNVYLETDSTQGERDKYKRLLRFVFLEDGTNFNRYMIEQGYAHEYTYNSNPYKYQLEFQQAQTEARDAERGLWAPNACK